MSIIHLHNGQLLESRISVWLQSCLYNINEQITLEFLTSLFSCSAILCYSEFYYHLCKHSILFTLVIFLHQKFLNTRERNFLLWSNYRYNETMQSTPTFMFLQRVRHKIFAHVVDGRRSLSDLDWAVMMMRRWGCCRYWYVRRRVNHKLHRCYLILTV